MTTLAPKPRRAAVLTVLSDLMDVLAAGDRATLSGLDWRTYESLLAARDAQHSTVRILYDGGEVELMTTSFVHETWKSLLNTLVVALVEETGGVYAAGGQMTIRREDLDRGFEPDDCYYLANAARVLPPRPLDFAVDPPPDLAVEIEHSRTILDRLPICAAFRIPEIWRYDGRTFTVLHLQPGGEYVTASASLSFPQLPTAEVVRFLRMIETTNPAEIGRRFRGWVRAGFPPAADNS